jgi:hypothetical protein
LKRTINFGIIYTDEFDVDLRGLSDSDWEGNTNDRRYIMEYQETSYDIFVISKI